MSSNESVIKPVKPILIVGVVLLPIIFVWALLEEGYTKKAKQTGFAWFSFSILISISRFAGFVGHMGIIAVIFFSYMISWGVYNFVGWIIDNAEEDGYKKTIKTHSNKYKEDAIKGDPHAQFMLGVNYELGVSAPHDLEEALRWYKLSADQQYPPGQMILGKKYEEGLLVPKDISKAFYFYSLSAQQGFSAGQHELASCYLHGKGVEIDEDEAERLLKLSSEQGYAESQVLLAKRFYSRRLHDEAERLFLLAAAQDNEEAQFRLGKLYERRKNYTQSATWYRLAALKGNVVAQGKIFEMYFDGRGVEKNIEQALFWSFVLLATDYDDFDALTLQLTLTEASKKLSDAKFAQIKEEADSFSIRVPTIHDV